MKVVIILFFIFINTSFAFNLNIFEDRQKVLQDVKSIISYEESIAKAYEEYILTNYTIPNLTQIKSLIGDVSTKLTGVTSLLSLDSSFTIISYGISNDVKADSSIKAFYESNSLRKRTYVRAGEIHFILEDSFAKHLFDLLKNTGSSIVTCPLVITTAINCKENNHIFIGVKDSLRTDFLMNYHIDKFKTGPIIISSDSSLHRAKDEFNSISKGALLYDTKGAKYVKTTSSIELLK